MNGTDTVFEALFEHNKSADTAVTVLERMDTLKLHMKLNNIFESYIFLAVIISKEFYHSVTHLRGELFPYRQLR